MKRQNAFYVVTCACLTLVIYQIWSSNLSTSDNEVHVLRPPHRLKKNSFIRVHSENQKLKFWTFNAYSDSRSDKNIVRVIGIGEKTSFDDGFYCMFTYDDHEVHISKKVSPIYHVPNNSVKYDGFTLNCENPVDISPNHVLISKEGIHDFKFPNHEIIRTQENRKSTNEDTDTIAICVSPSFTIHKEYKHLFIEWIEYHMIVGVTHFVIYNNSIIDDGFNKLLRYYVKRNAIEVVRWHPPVPVDTKGGWPPKTRALYFRGQFTTNTDCMYRLMGKYKWILYVDIDEFVVSRITHNLPDLLKHLSRKDPERHALIFHTALFSPVILRKNETRAVQTRKNMKLITQMYLNRKPEVYSWQNTSKIALKADQFGFVVGAHKVFSQCGKRLCQNRDKLLDVPPSAAIVHHYKWMPRTTNTITDKSMKRYADILVKAMDQVYADIFS